MKFVAFTAAAEAKANARKAANATANDPPAPKKAVESVAAFQNVRVRPTLRRAADCFWSLVAHVATTKGFGGQLRLRLRESGPAWGPSGAACLAGWTDTGFNRLVQVMGGVTPLAS